MTDDQKRVAELYDELGEREYPMPGVMDAWAFLVQEVGEVGSDLMRWGFGHRGVYARTHERDASMEELRTEIGQVYQMLIVLANALHVDLSEHLEMVLARLYEKHGTKPEYKC